jgi:hypothetical protein
MRSLPWGLLVTAISAFPIIQELREDAFWRAGQARFQEEQLLDQPLRFAGHTITIEDPLPRGGPPSEKAERGEVRVLLDGHEVLPAQPVMVRPGQRDLGRYHLWIDAWIFTDRRTGTSFLQVGRRRSGVAGAGRAYDFLRVDANGSHAVRRLSHAQRAESFPTWRTIQFLNDGTDSVYFFSLTNTWPTVFVPLFYPQTTLVIGIALLVIGWRERGRAATGEPGTGTLGGRT